EYSMWTREIERDALPVCNELGIGLVAYAPLGRGFLTGAIQSTDTLAPNDWRRTNPRFQGDNLESNLRLVDAVTDIARTHGCTPAQLALAWLLHRGPDIVPIPGTTRVDHLREDIEAAAVKLDERLADQLNALINERTVHGNRYSAQSRLEVDTE